MTRSPANRTYQPVRHKFAQPSRQQLHTIDAAYRRLTPEMFGVGQMGFNWALANARRTDQGH